MLKNSIFQIILTLVCLLLFGQFSAAQVALPKIKAEADQMFNEKKYSAAYHLYKRYNEYRPGISSVIKNLAACQIALHDIKSAKQNLEQLVKNGEDVNAEVYFYYGRTYHLEANFKNAIYYYKAFLRKSKLNDNRRQSVVDKIKRCEAGIDMTYRKQLAFTENLGSTVNSIWDEKFPIYSPNHEDKIYYSSTDNKLINIDEVNEQSTSNIFSSELIDGNWNNVKSFPQKFNTDQFEYPTGFFNNGNVLLFYRGQEEDRGRFLLDTFASEKERFNLFNTVSLFPNKGDQYVYIHNDSLILFSSKRPEGYGGYDIYYAQLKNGKWAAPTNLGPTINSAYDEICPQLTYDGLALYFSSNRTSSMGGYDIYSSEYLSSDWNNPMNLAGPINSPSDDLFFVLNDKGNSALMSSNRIEGQGGFDLFNVYYEKNNGHQIENKIEIPEFAMQLNIPKVKNNDTASNEKNQSVIIAADQELVKIYPPRTEIVRPIFYTNDGDILSIQSKKSLDKVADILQVFPNVEMSLYSYSNTYDGPVYFDLYFSIRKAELVAAYLQEKGITANRLHLYGMGSTTPLTNPGNPNTAKFNQRIDFRFMGTEEYNLDISSQISEIQSDIFTAQYLTLKSLMKGISFKIQVAKASQVYKDAVLSDYNFPLIQSALDKNTYYYSVGWTKTYDDANRLLKQLKTQGYAEVKILAYNNGQHIPSNKLNSLVGKYPALEKLIKSN